MAKLIFTVEGKPEDLDWVRTRIDGAIDEILEDSKEDGRISEATEYGWELED